MQKIDRNTISKGTKVIFLDPIDKKYYYATIWKLNKEYCVIYLVEKDCYKGIYTHSSFVSHPAFYAQLYYDNPENRTEALLNNITIY